MFAKTAKLIEIIFGEIMINIQTEPPEPRHLLTIRQLCLKFPWPSESAMRAYVFRADELGLTAAFVKVGRRVLIDPKMFFDLIQKVQNHSKKKGCNNDGKTKKS